MKTYDNILIEPGRIARLILNQPKNCNALSRGMMKDIIDGLQYLNADPQVVVIILSGNGKGFCAGADLSSIADSSGVIESIRDKCLVRDMLLTIGDIDKVVISQVHGFALAGGFGLAVTCDLTILSDDCKLGMPEIKRGLVPMNIMNPLSRLMSRKILLELMLTGNLLAPAKALELGLANKVVPLQELENTSMILANSIAGASGSAVKLCKNAFYQMQDMDYKSAFSHLTNMLIINALTEDSKEGILAFFEKRDPKWKDC